MDVLGLQQSEVISDCGFYPEDNLSLMFQESYNFITRAQYDVRWIRPEIDKVLKRMEDTANMCPDEVGTYGLTVCLTHEFEKRNDRANCKESIA